MPSFVHRITKYDPADRDERGHYTGPEDTTCDHGPVEAAYLAAIAAFAGAAGIERLEIREPAVCGPVNFGLEPTIEGDGLAGLFPAGPDGYHDGAEVSLPVALELVRAMLRDNGAWCWLEAGDAFTVHVGWDQYVFVGSEGPCEDAVARTRELGLFAEPLSASPYAPDFDEPGEQRPADEEFWELVRESVTARQAVLLEEGYVHNATRWHRVTEDSLGAVRTRLAPRAQLHVWPDLSTDVAAVLMRPARGRPGGARLGGTGRDDHQHGSRRGRVRGDGRAGGRGPRRLRAVHVRGGTPPPLHRRPARRRRGAARPVADGPHAERPGVVPPAAAPRSARAGNERPRGLDDGRRVRGAPQVALERDRLLGGRPYLELLQFGQGHPPTGRCRSARLRTTRAAATASARASCASSSCTP